MTYFLSGRKDVSVRQASILEVNEFLVLDYVRAQGATNRPEIATSLGLSASSVSRIIRRLVAAGLVTEGQGTSIGGRPRSAISFNSRAGCVLGIDLGGTKCHGAIADLSGTILAERIRPTNQEGGPYPTLLAMIETLSARATELGLPLTAIAVGAPAILDPDSGVALGGPNVHWHGFPLVAELAKVVETPFTVQNDVKLAALAHAWRGDGRRCADFAVVSIGTGIGAAVVLDGRLAQGRHNAAGEIGYLVLARDQLAEAGAREMGGFERLASGPAIAERAARRLERDASASRLREGPITTEAVFGAARAGDPLADALIDELCDHVAMAVISVAAVADPELVILEGSVGRALAPFLPRVVERVVRHLPTPPHLLISNLGANATMVGAVAAALQITRNQRAPAEFTTAFAVAGERRRGGLTLDVA